jgi:hypothetical protein
MRGSTRVLSWPNTSTPPSDPPSITLYTTSYLRIGRETYLLITVIYAPYLH